MVKTERDSVTGWPFMCVMESISSHTQDRD